MVRRQPLIPLLFLSLMFGISVSAEAQLFRRVFRGDSAPQNYSPGPVSSSGGGFSSGGGYSSSNSGNAVGSYIGGDFVPGRGVPLKDDKPLPRDPSLDYSKATVDMKELLSVYQAEALYYYKNVTATEWEAMTTGDEEAFRRNADAKLMNAKYHSDREVYARLRSLKTVAGNLTPIEQRAAARMELAYEQNQLPPELMQKMLEMSSELEQKFQTFRGKLDGKEYSNNDLLEMLEKEKDSAKRQAIWESLKQVGEEVAEHVVELAKVRNEAANKLGYRNYWEMQIRFQEHQVGEILSIFSELDRLTTPLFTAMKRELDAELAAKFNVPVDQLKPWHYDNPFFQQAPPSKEVDPNQFYKNKTREEMVEIATRYFKHIGLPYDEVLKRSDMFERSGKNQHAFSTDMDTLGDVRNLCNVKPTADWMDTILHEGGHGVYSMLVDRNLPFNLRSEAHIFTTEGIAMLFGAKARSPEWMIKFAGIEPSQAHAVAASLRKQRQREQLIFCRWTLVMLHFEKALYENPGADLNKLWWDMVERYQMLKRPKDRHVADWASKPHFVIAPVYYHNYMLGELFAAQLRQSLGNIDKTDDPQLGKVLTEKVFEPGAQFPWPEFVRRATNQSLSPRAFAIELQTR